MKITFDEVSSNKEWLHSEIMSAVSIDMISKAHKDGFYDVKLLINGVELEPHYLNDIFRNIEKYIDGQAKVLVINKLEEAKEKAIKLLSLVESSIEKIKEDHDLYIRDPYEDPNV